VGRTLFFDPAILGWAFVGAKCCTGNRLPVESFRDGPWYIPDVSTLRHDPRLVAPVVGGQVVLLACRQQVVGKVVNGKASCTLGQARH